MADENPTGGDAPLRADSTIDLAEFARSAIGSAPGAASRPRTIASRSGVEP